MRDARDIRQRLRDVHGGRIAKEMGGRVAIARASDLLWVLGHNVTYGDIRSEDGRSVDVSDYIVVTPTIESVHRQPFPCQECGEEVATREQRVIDHLESLTVICDECGGTAFRWQRGYIE